MFNYYYDFLYVPIYTASRANSGSTSSIVMNSDDLALYAYEFIVDDRNLGGTMHFDFESRMMVRIRRAIRSTSVLSVGSRLGECQHQRHRLLVQVSTTHGQSVRVGLSHTDR